MTAAAFTTLSGLICLAVAVLLPLTVAAIFYYGLYEVIKSLIDYGRRPPPTAIIEAERVDPVPPPIVMADRDAGQTIRR